MELSAVQPPSKPKGAAQQTCPPAVPLKTASPSSQQVPHSYIGGRVPRWRGQEGGARQGNAYPGELSSGHGRWWGQPCPLREAMSTQRSHYLQRLSQGLCTFLHHPTSVQTSGARFPPRCLWCGQFLLCKMSAGGSLKCERGCK